MRKHSGEEKEYFSQDSHSSESLNYIVEYTHNTKYGGWFKRSKLTGDVYMIMNDGSIRVVNGGKLKSKQFLHSAEPEYNVPCVKVMKGTSFVGWVTHESCISSKWKTYRDFNFVEETESSKLAIIETYKDEYIKQLKPYFYD